MPDRTDAVVKVGGGRGFIIEADIYPAKRRYVITAAHCLPHMPPAHAVSYTSEWTFERLIGPLGGEAIVGTECVFVDPVSDIAVLGEPDSQERPEAAEAYWELTGADTVVPFPVGALTFTRKQLSFPGGGPFGGVIFGPPQGSARGQMLSLSLDRRWFSCEVKSIGGRVASVQGDMPVEGGMSGSPILGPKGAAVGLVSTGENSANPLLMATLPGWLLRAVCGKPARRSRRG